MAVVVIDVVLVVLVVESFISFVSTGPFFFPIKASPNIWRFWTIPRKVRSKTTPLTNKVLKMHLTSPGLALEVECIIGQAALP